jgi:hypothetical protein
LAPKGSVRTIDLEDPYFFTWQDRKIDLTWGNRPPLLAGQRPVTRRQLEAYKNHVSRVSPLEQARRYQAELERPGVRTKVQAAKRLGVPYVRFVQTLSLLELDRRIIDFLDTQSTDPVVATTFTERRLRDLMAAGPEEAEWTRFQEILEKARSKSAVWTTLGPPDKQT